MLERLGEEAPETIPMLALTPAELSAWVHTQAQATQAWIAANGFEAKPGTLCVIPNLEGRISEVLVGRDDTDPWIWAGIAAKLAPNLYQIDTSLEPEAANWAALGWALAGYRFTRYRKAEDKPAPVLVWPEEADRRQVTRTITAIGLVRDLVNTPAEDLGPQDLVDAGLDLADLHAAHSHVITGEDLLAENYPAIHRVGRAATRPPCLLDFTWGDESAPKVTLVGKGVCFDTGGLDLKPASGMKTMKKDMGGAAHALALAGMIMDAGLGLRLRVLVPAVENAVSGNAMRPMDVIRMRNGVTVEIGNTDAEGRLILADCLAEACTEQPELLIDFATLTGAARVALGPDLPAMFANDDALAEDLLAAGRAESDQIWRLPLWKGYRKMLDSKIADLNSAPEGGMAGAVTAALFLQEFVTPGTKWAHFDIFALNSSARPGRPEGGEAMAIRGLFRMLAEKYPG